jgi:two-component system chemotaxis response regulator CheB
MSIRVLIIDDSALIRQLLSSILESDRSIEVVATAADPVFGLQKIAKFDPDVITCDVEMPRMNGLVFLKKLMAESPKPVVMISSHTTENCHTSLKALELGAVEVIQKPGGNFKANMAELSNRIVSAVKVAARAKLRVPGGIILPRKEEALSAPKSKSSAPPVAPRPRPSSRPSAGPAPVSVVAGKKHLIDELIPFKPYRRMPNTTKKVIAIGASTGGTVAVGDVMKNLPPTLPGIVIVQHIPAGFTGPFAERLDSLCRIEVREARDGDRVRRGTALIAPGDVHMLLDKDSGGYFVKIIEDSFPVNRHKPSVDVLFRSVANEAGPYALGIILTGMNDDGARAMKDMRDNGAYNIAQNEESCVVFGMPKNAIDRGGVNIVLPLNRIAESIIRHTKTD